VWSRISRAIATPAFASLLHGCKPGVRYQADRSYHCPTQRVVALRESNMYIPAPFRVSDESTIVSFIARYNFGTIVTSSPVMD